jgi:hypothetical protein
MTPFYSQHSKGHFQQGRGGGGPPRGPDPKTLDQIWPRYLSDGYFDDQGNLKLEFVRREQVEPFVQEMCQGNGLTSHQIRRYFGHCRTVETRLKSGGTIWETIRTEIYTLDRAAADGLAKSPPKIPKLFHDFIRRNVAAIKKDDDFLKGFLPHFEAIIGFGAAYFRKERS